MRSRHQTHDPPPPSPTQRWEVRDWRGRSYAVGPSARTLTGWPRSVVLARALTAAAAVGGLQFGYGAAVPSLTAAHGWSPAMALTPFLVWTLTQGACAPALHRLRVRGVLRVGPAIQAGALLCAAALVALGLLPGLLTAVLGYGVLGGLGAGLVYHSCSALVDGWFPDRRTVRSGAVGGAFALGWVPLLPAVAVGVPPSALPASCAALALLVLVLGLAGGVGQRSAPPRWWPPGSDPRTAALLAGADPPWAANLTPAQAWAAGGSLPILHLVVALSGASGLFVLAALPTLLLESGHPTASVALAVTVFAAGSGLGRLAAGTAAERTGRRRVLTALLGVGALAQVGLAVAVPTGQTAALVPLALVAGACTGSCYPLTRAITEGHFGPRWTADIHGLVYSSKAVGGLLGVGGAALFLALAPASVWPLGLAASGASCAAATALAALLRRPLPVRTTQKTNGVWTATWRRAPM
ncbi:MFS transporter [Nocardiopsis halotolerans]|uniref:MFS transporter n=1 Tax=Nocardiopsis halotolerans TaxID=124252 RepID=UPI00034D9D95|nr:MFS transporter [Nocardiopsis halotolerans]